MEKLSLLLRLRLPPFDAPFFADFFDGAVVSDDTAA